MLLRYSGNERKLPTRNSEEPNLKTSKKQKQQKQAKNKSSKNKQKTKAVNILC